MRRIFLCQTSVRWRWSTGGTPLQSGFSITLAPPVEACPDILLERQAAAMLAACLRAVGAAGRILPVSGWRSHAEQQAIWADTLRREGAAFTKKYVALPGCSEHETGLAIDLAEKADEIDFIRPAFPYDGVCGAFRRAAARYGFIERYREDKTGLTGIAAEPWHFRYVGAPHAQLMEQRGLCLEEYIALLGEAPLACTLENGRTVTVAPLCRRSTAAARAGPAPAFRRQRGRRHCDRMGAAVMRAPLHNRGPALDTFRLAAGRSGHGDPYFTACRRLPFG